MVPSFEGTHTVSKKKQNFPQKIFLTCTTRNRGGFRLWREKSNDFFGCPLKHFFEEVDQAPAELAHTVPLEMPTARKL